MYFCWYLFIHILSPPIRNKRLYLYSLEILNASQRVWTERGPWATGAQPWGSVDTQNVVGSQSLDGESWEGSKAGLQGGKLVGAGAFEAQDSAGVTLNLLGPGLVRPIARVDSEKK